MKTVKRALIIITLVLCLSMTTSCNMFGASVFRVLSGSMEPALPVGSYIVVQEVDTETLEVGDIITYMIDNPNTADTKDYIVCSHRVTEIIECNDEETGER